MTAAGPYDRWPLGRGFERYYGFLGGDTHQYYPELVRDNSQTEPKPPRAGATTPRPTWSRRPPAMIADAKQVAPEQTVLPVFSRLARCTRPSCAWGGADRYAGKVRLRLGGLPPRGLRPAEETGPGAPRPPNSAADPDVPDWGNPVG